MSRSRSSGSGSLRVVAGELGGRRFDAPPGSGTRPTSDRVRQALFNALDSMGAVDGAWVLDAFAGSGALGIEALSRGAAHVTFADTDPVALDIVRTNLHQLGLADRSTVLARPAAAVVGAPHTTGPGGGTGGLGGEGEGQAAVGSWDLVFLDPPYACDAWVDLLGAVARGLSPDGVVVIESDREVDLPGALVGVRSKTYGGTVVSFAVRTGAPT